MFSAKTGLYFDLNNIVDKNTFLINVGSILCHKAEIIFSSTVLKCLIRSWFCPFVVPKKAQSVLYLTLLNEPNLLPHNF